MGIENFATALEQSFRKENILTENGAVGYRTSGSPLVDFNFKMSSYRGEEAPEIVADFEEAFNYNRTMAMRMLFFAGDIRQGMGERKVFNSCLQWLALRHPEYCNAVAGLIPEYARWDYLVALLGTNCDMAAWDIIRMQFDKDMECLGKGQPVSLLAKWLPSVNASNRESNLLGKRIARRLMLKESVYRRSLSNLRKRIDVVEKKMSANKWSEIDYNSVPSKANITYRNAFLRHDGNRRREYLDALARNDGSAKINSSVAFPYEIVHSYGYNRTDTALEAMWKALPDFTAGNDTGSTLCVVDGSGSMDYHLGNTEVTAHDVARSLGIYFSERMAGPLKDRFITFSCNPQWVDLSKCKSLVEKIEVCRDHSECSNTDIEKTFDLLLDTAVRNHLRQDDLPGNILVISDMEFDGCTTCYEMAYEGHGRFMSGMKTLFEEISDRFKAAGYVMPRLVFWNVNSRTGAVPMQENEAGVALVSGFSPSIASMIFSGKLDPEGVLLDKLNSKRYDAVGEAVASLE